MDQRTVVYQMTGASAWREYRADAAAMRALRDVLQRLAEIVAGARPGVA